MPSGQASAQLDPHSNFFSWTRDGHGEMAVFEILGQLCNICQLPVESTRRTIKFNDKAKK